MDTCMVSILCLSYNHERYIEQALEGLVSQKTDFDYEILVHDDASTDSTADIVRRFEREYPHRIRAIYQTTNQYSQGVKITLDILLPQARGKYIAFCEGDDYWCDPNKLSEQVKFMERHSAYSVCYHNHHIVNANGDIVQKDSVPFKKNKTGEMREVLLGFVRGQTATRLFRANFLKGEIPAYVKKATVGDVPMSLWAAQHGKAYYMAKSMSCYRVQVQGSFTERVKKTDEGRQKLKAMFHQMYEDFDLQTEHIYHDDVCLAEVRMNFLIDYETGDIDIWRKKEYLPWIKADMGWSGFKLRLLWRFPVFYKQVKKLLKH